MYMKGLLFLTMSHVTSLKQWTGTEVWRMVRYFEYCTGGFIVFVRFVVVVSTNREGDRSHKGIDIVCDAASDIYSPITGRVIGTNRPYLATENPRRSHNFGIHIRGTGIWAGKNMSASPLLLNNDLLQTNASK